jgi:hypothetical protein
MPLGRSCCNLFLATIVAQQLAPSDLILSQYTDYPQQLFNPHHIYRCCYNALGARVVIVTSCIILALILFQIIHVS